MSYSGLLSLGDIQNYRTCCQRKLSWRTSEFRIHYIEYTGYIEQYQYVLNIYIYVEICVHLIIIGYGLRSIMCKHISSHMRSTRICDLPPVVKI